VKVILTPLKKILFWSYERGSLPYDVMCVLILAFIFLSPNSIFQTHGPSAPLIVRGDEIGQIDPSDPEPAIQDYLKRKGYFVRISRIEKADAASGETNYVVYPK
jgi:hypothetical protein